MIKSSRRSQSVTPRFCHFFSCDLSMIFIFIMDLMFEDVDFSPCSSCHLRFSLSLGFTKRNDKQNVLSWYSGMCLKHLLIMELYKYSDAALINFRVDFPLFPPIISWHCPVLSQGNKFEIDRGKDISGRCQARVLQ